MVAVQCKPLTALNRARQQADRRCAPTSATWRLVPIRWDASLMSKTARRRLLKGVAGSAALGVAGAGEVKAAGRRYSFVQWDVFTSEKLKGNPLAVFTDARGLEDADMAAIARETHLSETTFIFPREAAIEQEHGVLVRIFTPREELPFAGHPTLGTAMELRSSRMKDADKVSLDLKAGKISVTFHNER